MLSIAVAVLTILNAFTGLGVLYLIKILVDTITRVLTEQPEQGFDAIVFTLILVGLATLATALIQGLLNVMRMRQGLLVSDYVDRKIHSTAIAVDLQFYETPKYYDSLAQARFGGSQRPARAVGNAITLFSAALTLIGIFILITSVDWRLIPFLAIPILFALGVRLYFTRQLFNWRMARAQKERRASYLDMLMTNQYHAKELRLNRIGEHLSNEYSDIRKDLREGEIRIEQNRHISDFIFTAIAAVIFIGASAWLLNQSMNASREIGDVVLFVLLLRRAEASGNQFISNVSSIVDDHLYLQRIFQFFSTSSEVVAPENPMLIPSQMAEGIKLENVSFQYENGEKPALQNINMELHPKQIVALVGENGSGKTTLIKMLTRLYDPSAGRVTLDGIDIREFDPVAYRKLMSVIFQDYMAYADTAEANIQFGDVHLAKEEDRIIQSAKNAGAHDIITALPQGYQTPLSKIFDDGRELSIGQWQRIALARSFYPKSSFVILDEPTSAVDPKAEFELFENFRPKLGDRGALIISHRLSTIRQADYTYVLEDGRIVEHGTHDALVEQGGKYADLFEKQGRHYK
jgi:ATP-binding cassette subfamily B protein